MAEWFPAIRGYLAERGIRLPRPYPHPGRTVLGSALAALLAAALIGAVHTVYLAVRVADTATELASARLEEAAQAARQTVYDSAGVVTAGSDAVERALDLVAAATAGIATSVVHASSQTVTGGSHHLEQAIASLPARIYAWLAELLTPSPEVKTALERQKQEYERAKRGESAHEEEQTGARNPAEPAPDGTATGGAPTGDRSEAKQPEQPTWQADDWIEIVAMPSEALPRLPLARRALCRLGAQAALAVPWPGQAILRPVRTERFPPPNDEAVRQWRSLAALSALPDRAPRFPSEEDIAHWRSMTALPPMTRFAPLPPSRHDVRQWRRMAALPAPLSLAPLPPVDADLRQWRRMLRLPTPLDLAPRLPSAEDIRQWRVMAAVPPFTAFAPLPPSAADVRQWQTMAALPAPLDLAPPLPSAEDLRQWRIMIARPVPHAIAPLPPSAQDLRQWRAMIARLDLPVPSPSADTLRQWDERAASGGRPGRSRPALPPDAVAEVREAVSRNALPYLETPDAPVSDVVKQIDFALVQTVARLRLEEGRVFLLGRENRGEGAQQRLFQRMKIYLPKLEDGDAAATFAGLLAGTLEVWSERAVLSRPAWNRLILAVDGLETHDLRLEVVGDEFLLPPLEDGPRLTIVVDDMGGNPKALDNLLELDVPVTVAIWPRSRYAAETARRAHAAGREVLVHQPMEPVQAPYVDAGPGAITLRTRPERVREILAENLDLVPFASGLNNHMGSRFTQDSALCDVVCEVLTGAGLFALDSVTHADTVFYGTALRHGLPAYRRDIFLDDGPRTVKSVLAELRAAESVARKTGQAVAIGHPHPETLTALRQWCATRDTGIQVVPLRHLEQRRAMLTPADIDAATPQ